MRPTLILNSGGNEVIGKTSSRHARKMIYRGVAITSDPEGIHSTDLHSVELVKYVFTKWMYADKRTRKSFSKKGVLKRDGYLCAYCPSKATTIDHIVPRASGGPSSWMNCVASCKPCNSFKRDMSLKESGLILMSPPYVPH